MHRACARTAYLYCLFCRQKSNTNQDYIKNCRTLRWVRGLKQTNVIVR